MTDKEKCQLCHGSGYYEIIKDGESVMKICNCKKDILLQKSLDFKLTAAGIPIRYRKYLSIDKYLALPILLEIKQQNKLSIDLITRIINNPDYFLDNFNVLWIWGTESNSCHTTLAIAILCSMIEHNYKVKFLTMQELIKAITNFDNKEELQDLQKFNIYCIDDACDLTRNFISTKSDFVKIGLIDFFSSNLSNDKKFICTSNANIDSIIEQKYYKDIGYVLARYAKEIEIKGNITNYLKEQINNIK